MAFDIGQYLNNIIYGNGNGSGSSGSGNGSAVDDLFSQGAGYDWVTLGEDLQKFQEGLDFQRQQMEKLGIPELQIKQQLAQLEAQKFAEMQREYNSSTGADYLKFASQLGGPANAFQAVDFYRGAQQRNDIPVFLQNLANVVGSGGPSANVAFQAPGTPPEIMSPAYLAQQLTGNIGTGGGTGTGTGGTGGTSTGGATGGASTPFTVGGYQTPPNQAGQGKDPNAWIWDQGAEKFVRWDGQISDKGTGKKSGGIKQLTPAQYVEHFGALPDGYNWSQIITRGDRLGELGKTGYQLPTTGSTIIATGHGNEIADTGRTSMELIDVSKPDWRRYFGRGGNVTPGSAPTASGTPSSPSTPTTTTPTPTAAPSTTPFGGVPGYTVPNGQQGQGKDPTAWQYNPQNNRFMRDDDGIIKKLGPGAYIEKFGALPSGFDLSQLSPEEWWAIQNYDAAKGPGGNFKAKNLPTMPTGYAPTQDFINATTRSTAPAPAAPATPAAPSQPDLGALPTSPVDQHNGALGATATIFAKGAQALTPGSLERLTPDEMAVFGSGLKAVGGDLPSFLEQYRRSRPQQQATASTAYFG